MEGCWLGDVTDEFVDIVLNDFLVNPVNGSGEMAVQDALKSGCMVRRLGGVTCATRLVDSVVR